MKEKRFVLNVLFLLGLVLTSLHAQNAVPVAGGNALGSGGTVNYTVGQVVYTTHTGTNGSVAQGIQQPYEISIVSGLEKAKGIELLVSVYPNPTAEYVKLKVDASTLLSIQSMSYQLFDINGKLLATKKLEGNETSISMGNLVPSTYFLKVIKNNKEFKTFKIIKTQAL